MNLPVTVNQEELLDILLNIAPARPVFIWGAPGIGKSALVEEFSMEVGLECVSLLGSQLAPEDIIGIPQIRGETSEFLPPKMIARKEPYVLSLMSSMHALRRYRRPFTALSTREGLVNTTFLKAALSLVQETAHRMQQLLRQCPAHLLTECFMFSSSLT